MAHGAGALHRLLAERTLDLRTLDTPGFRGWLDRHLARWARDPAFVQRTRMRDLRRAHPRLRSLEAEERRAAAADEASPGFERLQRIEHALTGAGKAVAGLSEALERASAEERAGVRRKLDGFRVKQRVLEEEQRTLVEASPERQALLRIRAELQRLRATLGLEREEARLRELLTARGRGSGRRCAAFEDAAPAATQQHLLPGLPREGVRVLRGVTLGAARMEVDQLVVRCSPGAGEPVEVLALVEVKRNLNDLAHGFHLRQENLAWLTGDETRYDPELYRTRSFPAGRFDGAVHESDGERYVFDAGSFRRFRPDSATGMILDGLYLITRPGAVWGVSSAALARIGHRVATDERWDPESEAYLQRLLEWCRSLAHPVETPDVLRMYASTEARARQVLLVEV